MVLIISLLSSMYLELLSIDEPSILLVKIDLIRKFPSTEFSVSVFTSTSVLFIIKLLSLTLFIRFFAIAYNGLGYDFVVENVEDFSAYEISRLGC
ncbi:hypothetical protein THALO_160003 [Tenacibaculum halocynthiae]